MPQTQHWQPAALAAALGVPEEAFRAFARLRQIAWEEELSPPEAAIRDDQIVLLGAPGVSRHWSEVTGVEASKPDDLGLRREPPGVRNRGAQRTRARHKHAAALRCATSRLPPPRAPKPTSG